jgi:uncharacterized protein involved in type VI secretion and phage assembly
VTATVALSPSITLGGRELAKAWQEALIEARVDCVLARPGRVVLRFVDPGYALLASEAVRLGVEIEVRQPGASGSVIVAEVTEVSCEQREGEQPELVIVGHDRSHRLGRMAAVKTYLTTRVGQVVERLAQAVGLQAEADPSLPQLDYLLQVDTNLGLLDELAARTGCDWWVEGRTLHFAKPHSGGLSSRLRLGDTLRSFSVRASGSHPDSVVVDGWDRDQQESVRGEATRATAGVVGSSRLADLASASASAYGQASVVTSAVGAKTQEEATMLSQALLDRQLAASVEAWGTAEGVVSLSLGQMVEVSDAGPLSGNYPVTSLSFVYRPHRGSMLRFRCGDRRPTPIGLASGGVAAGSAGGSVVSHAGLIVGVVTNINDPSNQGRVKVRFPGLAASEESAWARILGIGGGHERGFVFVPEVNDEVLVAFEGGDTRLPVVIGGLYGAKSTIPKPEVQDGKVQTRQLQSRLGHYIKFLDGASPATQGIELTLAGGQSSIHMGKDKLAITVPSGTPVEITAGQAVVSIAKDGGLSMKAPTIAIEAQSQLQLKAATIMVQAQGSLSVQSNGVAAVKGTTLALQGSTAVTLAGPSVAIN